MLEIVFIVGGIATLVGAGLNHLIHDCIVNRKMKNNLKQLGEENNKLHNSITNIKNENKLLSDIREDLEDSKDALKYELENLKKIMKIGGEHGEEIYQNMINLFNEYKNIVDTDIRTKTIGLLCDLDTNNDFIYSPEERKAAKSKLRLLFSEQHINIIDSDFDDISILKEKLMILFCKQVKN